MATHTWTHSLALSPSATTADNPEETHESLLALLGVCQSQTSAEDENINKSPVFDPELVISHCFRRLKQDLPLPQSRRRIIMVPCRQDQVPICPTPQPQAPLQPIPSFKALEVENIREQPVDMKTWLSQRASFRKELHSFGDVKRWLKNKPSITSSEAKVLDMTQEEHGTRMMDLLTTPRATKKKAPRVSHRKVPQLRLPKPPALSVLYSYLRNRKLKILEIFNKADRGENQNISREEFILALKAIGVPLKSQEVEDIVIYLGSLGKHNAITTDALDSTYKQWSLAQQRSTVPTAREYYMLAKHRDSPKSPLKKPKVDSAPQPPKMDLLTVPEVDTQMEARPLTLEEMEDVGRRYRERRRQRKLSIPSIEYTECCRLVRCGNPHFDKHCLPSTIAGEMEELINAARRDAFLVYLQCWKLCEAYGLSLTEDILMKALLYPGDKILFQNQQVRPIRQPGGYYCDWKIFTPSLAMTRTQGLAKSRAKRMDKKSSKKTKKMHFKEFEEFTRKVKAKRLSGSQFTHPNFFWPGHLLDKLRLYLPTVATDRSLALFSCVQHKRHAYSATYHADHWWPLRDVSYMTHAYYDAAKVYSIS